MDPSKEPKHLDKDEEANPSAATASTREGVGAAVKGSPQSLSQLERDILSKQAAKHRGVSPGVVGVNNNEAAAAATAPTLSQVERDVLAKQRAQGASRTEMKPGVPSLPPSKLSQVEQDVLAKQVARGGMSATRPGVFSVTTPMPPSSNNETSGLSQFERDIMAKRQPLDIQMSEKAPLSSTATSGPSVAAGESVPNNTNHLSQLERDVLSKQRARGPAEQDYMRMPVGNSALPLSSSDSRTTSVNDDPSHASQLERDILAKQAARGERNSAARPGAFSATQAVATRGDMSDMKLSQIQRDASLKQSVSNAAAPSPNAPDSNRRLTEMESDVLAKQNARIDSVALQPGAQRMDVSAAESNANQPRIFGQHDNPKLSQLELDVLAKQNARNMSNTIPGASVPSGAASIAGGNQANVGFQLNDSNLSRLERDVIAKQNARGPVSDSSARLSQSEADALSKSHATNRANLPGAVTSFQASQSHPLSQLEYDIASKTRAGPNNASQPGAFTSSSLSQLEQNIALKSQGGSAGGTLKATPPGNYAGSGLNQMEQDILAKNQARSYLSDNSSAGVGWSRQTENVGATTSTLSQLEQDVMLKDSLKAPSSALSQLEQDALAKSNARGATFPSQNAGALSSLSRFEADVLRNNGAHGAPNEYYGSNAAYGQPSAMYDQRQQYGVEYGARSPYARGELNTSLSSSRELEMRASSRTTPLEMEPAISQSDFRNQYSSRALAASNQVRSSADSAVAPDVAVSQPEAPLYPTLGDSVDALVTEAGGIEAFIAENVIDATGVAVIMSDEEEAILEKKRQRMIFFSGGACVIITLAIIIVSTITTRKSPSSAVSTVAPTFAPTFAPTLSPTGMIFPEAATSLSAYSNISDLTNRNAPQFKAMDWLLTDDEYVRSMGLSFNDPKWIQRYIVVVFYYHFGGDSWRKCNRNDKSCQNGDKAINNWLSYTDECTWFLLGCANDVLNAINFLPIKSNKDTTADIWLTGTMPHEITHLSGLEQFVFPPMSLQGEILPLLSGMPNLSTLVLSGQSFTGSILPLFEANYSNLTTVELDSNSFFGSIPTSVGSVSGLTNLVLSGNNLTGTVPSELGDLTSLAVLEIADNKLGGPIPSTLYREGITRLIFGGNAEISGFIPDEIKTMNDLQVYGAAHTKMNGVIPSSMYSVASLMTMNMSFANFTGTIAEEISNLNQTLVFLLLDNNKLNGEIPTGIGALTKLEVINLQNNNLNGSIPKSLCSRRGFNPGQVQSLIVDCNIDVPCINDNPCSNGRA